MKSAKKSGELGISTMSKFGLELSAIVISLASLGVAFKARRDTRKMSTSDFQVSEQVKKDLAHLTAALDALVYGCIGL